MRRHDIFPAFALVAFFLSAFYFVWVVFTAAPR